MSTSYPYLSVARMRGLPYEMVLKLVDHLDRTKRLSFEEQQLYGMSDWKWIAQAYEAEQLRRRTTQ